MAMTTPQLYTVPYFDATQPQGFTFYVAGGNQVVGSTLTIRDNTTLSVVYTNTVTTYQFVNTLPANALTNGNYYQATLTTTDGTLVSEVSNAIQFYCYAQPTYVFTNISQGGQINNSSQTFNVQYTNITTSSTEYLNEYVFNLYSAAGILIASSGAQYVTDNISPKTIGYLFNGLSNNTAYEIECVGITTGNRNITTGRISFTAIYTTPSVYNYLQLTNNCDGGYINIYCDVIGIAGASNPDPPIYLYDSSGDPYAVDLTADGTYVEWDSGYKITTNYTATIWGINFNDNSDIVQFSNTDGSIVKLRYIRDTSSGDVVYVELTANDNFLTWGYETQSNSIAVPATDEEIFIWLRQVSGLYDVIIENRGVPA